MVEPAERYRHAVGELRALSDTAGTFDESSDLHADAVLVYSMAEDLRRQAEEFDVYASDLANRAAALTLAFKRSNR